MTPPLFASVSNECSRLFTHRYSTSFSSGVRCLARRFHEPIHAIYGFVRVADEIVDSFEKVDRGTLLKHYQRDTYRAIRERVSTNPLLEAFQRAVNHYGIEYWTIERFFDSMWMDLQRTAHDRTSYSDYILGSAEVVGLMCLRVFAEGDDRIYQQAAPHARSLGAAFQKVNFLRDLQEDQEELGRSYFPQIRNRNIALEEKRSIESEIEQDFRHAYEGIVQLPKGARFGVYVAYIYYQELFKRIVESSPERIEQERVRIPNLQKGLLLLTSYLKYQTLSYGT